MTFPRRICRSLRDLSRDEQGDEGVSKMLILLLVTVPIILVLVIFGGKIVDEFKVGLCDLGIIDPPEWLTAGNFPWQDRDQDVYGAAWRCRRYRVKREDVPEGYWRERYDRYGE